MDSRLDETEDLITSVEVSEDDLPSKKPVNVKIGVLGTSQDSGNVKVPVLQRKNY